ncbi:hypothetical protein [Halomonas heilongjiangensis]|uniref:hypothetical protein n=1 Tax=Halomonas heilongjiangensis TaxID=1387883 RepID=UPI0011AFC7FB|nr:hypothetical protein [Halomonas heilongjiangensis]
MSRIIKAEAQNITNINNIELGWVSGFGNYTAKFAVGEKVVNVENLIYQYGVVDQGDSVGVETHWESDHKNKNDIKIEAAKANIKLDDGKVSNIVHQLESQVKETIDKRYGINDIYINLSLLEGHLTVSFILNERPKGEALYNEIERIEKETEKAADLIRMTS